MIQIVKSFCCAADVVRGEQYEYCCSGCGKEIILTITEDKCEQWEREFDKIPQGKPANNWDNYITVANAKNFIRSILAAQKSQFRKMVEEEMKECQKSGLNCAQMRILLEKLKSIN